jgi:hypothetical protein
LSITSISITSISTNYTQQDTVQELLSCYLRYDPGAFPALRAGNQAFRCKSSDLPMQILWAFRCNPLRGAQRIICECKFVTSQDTWASSEFAFANSRPAPLRGERRRMKEEKTGLCTGTHSA